MDLCISECLKRLQVKATAGVTDNVGLAAERVDDTGIFHSLINVLMSKASTEYEVVGKLMLSADRKFRLLKGFKIRIHRAVKER